MGEPFELLWLGQKGPRAPVYFTGNRRQTQASTCHSSLVTCMYISFTLVGSPPEAYPATSPCSTKAHLWGLGNHLILPHSGAALVCSRPGMSSATTHVLALSIYSTHTSMNTISPPGPLITAKAVEHIHRYYIRSVRIC